MADPVLRIPVDDAAFKRYMEAFERYQTELQAQPDMWADANEAVLAGVAANLSLADAIGQSVSAAIRLGDVQERNSLRKKRDSENANLEEQRASSWRRKALDHVQELSRSAATVVRSIGGLATGAGGTGGLFGMVADAGKGMGGDLGAVVSLAGHALNAGYEVNNSVSNRGLFAQGIGATLGQQEAFHNDLGRYTNTDQGIDSVMKARGTAEQQWVFSSLGVKNWADPNADDAHVYAQALRGQVELAKRATHGNVTNWSSIIPRGALAFGTTQEDLNKLKGLSGAALEKKLAEDVAHHSALTKKDIDAATNSAVATDKAATAIKDLAAHGIVQLDKGLDVTTSALQKLADAAGNLSSIFSFGGPSGPGGSAAGGGVLSRAWHWLTHPGEDVASAPAKPAGAAKPSGAGAARSMPATAPHASASDSDTMKEAEALGASEGWRVTSGTRSHAKQVELWNKRQAYLQGRGPFQGPVARPGTSMHEYGEAVDIGRSKGLELTQANLAKIKAEFIRRGIKVTEALFEGDHFHIGWGAKHHGGHGTARGASVANTQVHVKVTVPPGHQPAVSVNSAAGTI